jgi:polyisoprenoid-binding protein YceI
MKSQAAIWMSALVMMLFADGQILRAESFVVDPVHSSVLFRSGHLGMSHVWGRFGDVAGTISFDEQNPAANAVEIEVKSASVDSGNAKRDEHLRSPDFLNAKQFPSITFKSQQVKQTDANNYEVTGTLTLHGVSKPATVKLQKLGSGKTPFGDVRTGMETTFQIKRSDFDMKNMLEAVGDDVVLIVSLEGAHR